MRLNCSSSKWASSFHDTQTAWQFDGFAFEHSVLLWSQKMLTANWKLQQFCSAVCADCTLHGIYLQDIIAVIQLSASLIQFLIVCLLQGHGCYDWRQAGSGAVVDVRVIAAWTNANGFLLVSSCEWRPAGTTFKAPRPKTQSRPAVRYLKRHVRGKPMASRGKDAAARPVFGSIRNND